MFVNFSRRAMLIVFMCVIIKFLEFSSGHNIVEVNNKVRRRRKRKRKCLGKGVSVVQQRGMMTEDKLTIHSPESDCNSNTLDSTASYASNTSSQDVDFIQDNSDYQWFLDYGYRDSNHHASILSLSTSYEVGCYDDLARDIDTHLAEVDMEDFRAEDILSTLPAMCCTDLQSERQGEMFASVSGSMMVKFDFDSSLSPHSSSQEESNGSMSMAEPLFSPVKEIPLPATNYSMDSLDCEEQDMLLTCQANKDNYTIAFEGSTVMGDDSDYHDTGDSEATSTWSSEGTGNTRRACLRVTQSQQPQMTSSDAPFTTWSKLVKRSSEAGLKDKSARGCVKLYDIQNNSSSLASDSNSGASSLSSGVGLQTTQQRTQNFSLLRLFIKQRSGSNSTMEQSAASDCNYTTSEIDARRNSRSLNEFECRETLCDNRKQKVKKINFNNLNGELRNRNNEIKSITNDTNYIKDEVTTQCFEDSLVHTRSHDFITEEEEDVSDSVERLTESSSKNGESVSVCSCEASLTISRAKFNVNNNNSLEREDIRSPVVQLRRGTQTHLSQSSLTSTSSTSDPTDATRIHISHGTAVRNSATQCPMHCMDKSMQTSSSLGDKKTSEINPLILSDKVTTGRKPVYVLYPNYTLPDLDFLREHQLDLEQVFLTPVKFSPGWTPPTTPTQPSPVKNKLKPRPFSCFDIDELRKKGFGHVQDWESLAFLLPREYCQLLADVPEIRQHTEGKFEMLKPLFCVSPPMAKTRPCEYSPFPDGRTTVNVSSSSSTGTQPSSGYRGSSTLLTDSGPNPSPQPTSANPLFVYRYDSLSSESGMAGPPLPKRSISLPEEKQPPAPPRPPLPKGILRNSLENAKMRKNSANKKRYSMFDMESADYESELESTEAENKRMSYPSTKKCLPSDSCDGSDEGLGGEIWPRPPTPPGSHALRLQELLEMSGEQWDPKDMDNLRAQVSKFLSQNGRKCVSFADNDDGHSGMTPPNSPQSSLQQKAYQCKLQQPAVREDLESSYIKEKLYAAERSAKVDLVNTIGDSVQKLLTSDLESSENISKLTLSTLCPALYAVLSDGLKATLETPFGDINNSVWQVIEASSQQGPMTKALHELVLKLNSEDVLTEGVIKFNAFIFGLLNVQGLDVWFSYLRTRESVLRKHYNDEGLMLSACRGQSNNRALTDRLLDSLKPLAQHTFKLDLLYETRLLHQSLLQLGRLPLSPSHSNSSSSSKGSWTLRRLMQSIQNGLGPSQEEDPACVEQAELTTTRPRSCVDSVGGFSVVSDIASTVRKRWSGIHLGSKLVNAFDRLAPDDTEEEYSDSLETGVPTSNVTKTSTNGDLGEENSGKFRRLQMKWEMLSGRESATQSRESTPMSSPVKSSNSSVSGAPKSRIPRPVTSPVRPLAGTTALTPQRPPIKKTLLPTSQLRKPNFTTVRNQGMDGPIKGRLPAVTRPSRMDLPTKPALIQRPSSLPYRPSSTSRAPDLHRRAVSSSTVRRTTDSSPSRNQKFVVTLSHRLPSDSGHLAFNKGERLRLVLEVDETWLLCCRGDHKGLVPRSAVIPLPARI
uniref:SH3 domain-containing protein n=1 Tax=Clastoptera arizonana TaxID=38151 RepID=A0A1B6D1K6_9HEMI